MRIMISSHAEMTKITQLLPNLHTAREDDFCNAHSMETKSCASHHQHLLTPLIDEKERRLIEACNVQQ